MPKETVKVVAYVRYSPRPGSSDARLANQFGDIRRYCAAKNYKIVGVFKDRMKSGSNMDRPGFIAAMKACPTGGRLVVRSLDRISREVIDLCVIEDQLKKKKARIETVDGTGNEDSPTAKLVRTLLTAINQYQRELSAHRTKSAMIRYQAAGKRVSLIPPYGFKSDGQQFGRLIPVESEQQAVQLIVRLRKDGTSWQGIADGLERAGVKSRAPSGKWRITTLRQIVRRETATPMATAQAG